MQPVFTAQYTCTLEYIHILWLSVCQSDHHIIGADYMAKDNSHTIRKA